MKIAMSSITYLPDVTGQSIYTKQLSEGLVKRGYEVDVYTNWKINSDLTLSVQAGRFKPGDGFTRDASRDLGAINLTISF